MLWQKTRYKYLLENTKNKLLGIAFEKSQFLG